MKRFYKFVCLVVVMAVIPACAKNSPTAPSIAPDQGGIRFALDIAKVSGNNITSGTVSIAKGALSQTQNISMVEPTGTVAFFNIQVGKWNISVKLYDQDGTEIYSGTGEAVVGKNTTTSVNIRVIQNTGNLQIVEQTPGENALCISYSTQTAMNLLMIGAGVPTVLKNTEFHGGEGANNCRGGNLLVYDNIVGINTIHMDGSHDVQIYSAAHYPRWSWDGLKIAAGIYGYPNHIVVMDAQGGNRVDLMPGTNELEGHDEYPFWTPDGKIIYRRYWTQSQTAAIAVMNYDGSNRQIIKQFDTAYVFPTDCSATGKILFDSSMENYRYHVYVMNMDGSGITNLTADTSYEARNAKFSADGQKIIFDTYGGEIYMMNADGSEKTFITLGSKPYFIY
ncbi:MAG: hypothetical protein HGA76_06565 [Candidatus Firestonebacteria bacterium]|nr:hypothetical protein [Candidatus Firestonebacteria bacterium]